MLNLMLITNRKDIALRAIQAGVNRLFIDLEKRGKVHRQKGRNTVISMHCSKDISMLRNALPDSEILVRINPIYDRSKHEVEEAINKGADLLMLPMFTHPKEVETFIRYVDGKAKISLLLETPQAMVRLPEILKLSKYIHEIHVGLNDLHIGLGLNFMFECVAGGLIDVIAEQVLSASLCFGFGGIGKLGKGAVPAELVLSEHIRIGSSMAILSRTFHEGVDDNFSDELRKLREEEKRLRELPVKELEKNRKKFNQRVWKVAGCR